jgi:hypothetical protein
MTVVYKNGKGCFKETHTLVLTFKAYCVDNIKLMFEIIENVSSYFI